MWQPQQQQCLCSSRIGVGTFFLLLHTNTIYPPPLRCGSSTLTATTLAFNWSKTRVVVGAGSRLFFFCSKSKYCTLCVHLLHCKINHFFLCVCVLFSAIENSVYITTKRNVKWFFFSFAQLNCYHHCTVHKFVFLSHCQLVIWLCGSPNVHKSCRKFIKKNNFSVKIHMYNWKIINSLQGRWTTSNLCVWFSAPDISLPRSWNVFENIVQWIKSDNHTVQRKKKLVRTEKNKLYNFKGATRAFFSQLPVCGS